MSNWISIKDQKPKSGEDVLAYWWEPDIHQIHMVTYWRKGDVMEYVMMGDHKCPGKNLLDVILENPKNAFVALEDGFYIYEGERFRPWRKHSDCITHWMPLPNPPNNHKGMLAGLSVGE